MNHFAYPKGNKVAFENFPKGRGRSRQTKNSRDTFSLIQMGDAYRTTRTSLARGTRGRHIFAVRAS